VIAAAAPRYRLALVVPESTAMPFIELESLTWGDVDAPAGRWRVARQREKAARGRWVAVPPDVFAAVDALVPREDRATTARVFPRVEQARLRAEINRACRATGTPAWSPHDLRHRRISLWHRQGIDWHASGPGPVLTGRHGGRLHARPRGRSRGGSGAPASRSCPRRCPHGEIRRKCPANCLLSGVGSIPARLRRGAWPCGQAACGGPSRPSSARPERTWRPGRDPVSDTVRAGGCSPRGRHGEGGTRHPASEIGGIAASEPVRLPTCAGLHLMRASAVGERAPDARQRAASASLGGPSVRDDASPIDRVSPHLRPGIRQRTRPHPGVSRRQVGQALDRRGMGSDASGLSGGRASRGTRPAGRPGSVPRAAPRAGARPGAA